MKYEVENALREQLLNERSKAGLVACDDRDCLAKVHPKTLQEYKIALEHWIEHSYLSGCSHAN